jgi:hypothetical protein
MWNGSWSSNIILGGDGVFDISAYRATGGTLAKYATLAAALDDGNNIPQSLRKGGMSVKFVQSSDNKYVQYILVTNEWSTNIEDWQKVILSEDLDEMWYSTQDTSSINITQNYGIIMSGQQIGMTTYNTGLSCTGFIDISNADGGTVKVSVLTIPTDTNVGIVFYNEEQSPIIGYKFIGEKYNQFHEIAIPQNAKYLRTTLWKDTNTYGGLKVYALKKTESIPDELKRIDNRINEVNNVNDSQQQEIDELKGQIMNMDKTSVIAVDLMQFCHARNTMTSLDYISIVSSTSDSITLSESDAAAFRNDRKYGQAAAVGFSDGSYRMVFFGNRSGNTIPRASFDSTDLTNAQKVQSLHDTLSSGNGQHLSPSGYLAMANFVASEIEKQTSMIDKNWLGGIIFNEMKLTPGYQNTNANNWIYDANDNVVCKPIFYNWMWGGYTPNETNTINERGVSSNSSYADANGWVTKCYHIIQGKQGAYIEFPISLKGKGFIEIQAAKLAAKTTSTGDCKLSVYADDVLVGENELVMSQTRYIFDNVNVNSELRVRFTLLDAEDTDIVIYSIGMWEMHTNVNAQSIEGSTIAVLGDSWTQFPNAATALSDHESYNEIVVYPNGTNGDGYGYFPKELARLAGATVDNWGKSNMRADNWGLEMIDTVLNFKQYDYLIIEFFINDYNANIPKETWLSNIKSICRKCQRKNTRPIFIMPCSTNSFGQSTGLGAWHEYVLKGLDIK